jgi:hypothetical protein
MSIYTWRTDERGIVWVTRPGEPEHTLTLGLQMAALMDRVITRWEQLAETHAIRVGIPRGWILAMIWRESGGNPNARNPEGTADPSNDGIGLLQLTSSGFKIGHTDSELMNPDLNLRIGTDYIASLARRYQHDFPRVSAAFNAGSVRPSDANPFGMYTTGNHIEAEIAALDYYLTRTLPPEVVAPVRMVPDEEILAQGAALLAELTRTEDFGARDLSADHPATEPSPPPDMSAEPSTRKDGGTIPPNA